ncbi:MAG: HNH endonuclease [Actinobacteria bacterium]|nr:HNH endonuclease [Actinomycetota bacterium]
MCKDKKVAVVYVLSKRGNPLMPCSPRKARVLLKQSKANVLKRTPFTIQLKIDTPETTQPISLGIDSGYSHIGLSAITSNKELYSADVKLRTDIVKLLSKRRAYRRARRSRNLWYRKPRFKNRDIPEGWFAPSIRHKLNTHIKMINKVKEILPITQINIEVASFDIQKIKNPDISGVEYQNGPQKNYSNTREYILHRDNHTCQNCMGKSKDPILTVVKLQTHHIESRQTGGKRPDNLITLCLTCHDKVTKGEIELNVKPLKGFKAETFMTKIRWELVDQLKEQFNKVFHTYGYITKQNRKALELPKSHTNDAFVIAGGTVQKRLSNYYLIEQVRNCNRKLFKGIRSHIRNTAERFIQGFQRFDKVSYKDIECFIFGRRASGYFDLKKLDGSKIHASAKYTDLTLLERSKTLLIERRMALLPYLKEGVSEP